MIRKKSRNLLLILFTLLFLTAVTPLKGSAVNNIMNGIQRIQPIDSPEYTIDAIPFPDERPIKVAIYEETNLSAVSYDAFASEISNNVTNLVEILEVNPKFEINIVNADDIFNHALQTTNFDVVVLLDNNPREYIVNMVLEFWLAGGGIVAFDGTASFLSYAGIFPPEASGSNGFGTYWSYLADGYNITDEIISASKAYEDYTVINMDPLYSYAAFDISALTSTSINGQFTTIATNLADPAQASIIGFNPFTKGGKVIHIGYDLNHEEIPELDQLIRDSMDWVTPRPKAKIAFDYSHLPRLSIDAWDELAAYKGYYYDMRNHLVSHGYTVDKYYPSLAGDNFTLERLEKYDMIISVSPDYNFTTGDKIAMEEYIASGGSLLSLGERKSSSFTIPSEQLTELLNPFGISYSVDGTVGVIAISDRLIHPTTEGALSLEFNSYGYLNTTGDAYPIWYDGPQFNVVVAASEFGEGRVIATSDINWLSNFTLQFDHENNRQYLLNAANWLTASQAKVLIYTDWTISSNFYRAPLPLSLNDLGINYYLTSSYESPFHDYFNLSMYLYEWDMVIIDAPNKFGLETYFDDIEAYVDSGGNLIMTTFDVDVADTHPLWAKLGFEYNSTFSDQPPMFIWDTEHPIFNQPFDYSAENFTYGIAYSDDGDRLTVLPNGIPLAGLTNVETADEASIILRDDEKTLFNGYLIDEFTADTDDSGYQDNFELWKNEIAYMMRPKLTYQLDGVTELSRLDSLNLTLTVTNEGLSDATIGYIDLVLPPSVTTTSGLEHVGGVEKGGTFVLVYDHINFGDTGNFSLEFESFYQGYLGTIYGEIFTFDVSVSLLPMWLWYVIAGGGGGLLLIILVIIIAASVRKKKRKVATR